MSGSEPAFGAAFLTSPSLFPARLAGERWGEGSALLDLAGELWRLEGLSPEQLESVRRRYGTFFCRNGVREPDDGGGGDGGGGPRQPSAREPSAEVSCRVFRAPPEDFRPVDGRGLVYEPDCDPGPGTVRLAGIDVMGLLADRSGRRSGVWTPHGHPDPDSAGGSEARSPGDPFLGALENVLRLQLAYRLLDRGGLLLHSAGMAPGGASAPGEAGAALLFGPSGAGKTTSARLALEAGWEVWGDDLNAVLPAPPDRAGGDWEVHALPFFGDLGDGALGDAVRRPGGALSRGVEQARRGTPRRLALLGRLEKASKPALRPCGPGASAAAVLAASPGVNQDPHTLGPLAAVIGRLIEAVPVRVAAFAPDPGFLPALAQACSR